MVGSPHDSDEYDTDLEADVEKSKGDNYNKYKIIACKMYVLWKYDWLIDWCLTPTLVVFQLYHGVLMEI